MKETYRDPQGVTSFNRGRKVEMSNVILVTKDGFAAYCPDVLDHFVMRYDENGIYIGQEQENMIESNPPIVFIRPELIDGVPHVNGKPVEPLTEAEMSKAKGENQ